MIFLNWKEKIFKHFFFDLSDHAYKHRIDLILNRLWNLLQKFKPILTWSHLYRLTNKQVSYGLCCQNTLEQVGDNKQKIKGIDLPLSVERPWQRVILPNSVMLKHNFRSHDAVCVCL